MTFLSVFPSNFSTTIQLSTNLIGMFRVFLYQFSESVTIEEPPRGKRRYTVEEILSYRDLPQCKQQIKLKPDVPLMVEARSVSIIHLENVKNLVYSIFEPES